MVELKGSIRFQIGINVVKVLCMREPDHQETVSPLEVDRSLWKRKL